MVRKTSLCVMSLVKSVDITNLPSLPIISIPLNICSGNFGYMNLYQLGVFGYMQQKQTLGNISKKGDWGKDRKQPKSIDPQNKIKKWLENQACHQGNLVDLHSVKNTWLSLLGATAELNEWHGPCGCSTAVGEQGLWIIGLSSCAHGGEINLQKEPGATLKGLWNRCQPAKTKK